MTSTNPALDFHDNVRNGLAYLAVLLLSLLITTIIASITYQTIEIPGIAFGRGLIAD